MMDIAAGPSRRATYTQQRGGTGRATHDGVADKGGAAHAAGQANVVHES